MTKQATTLSSLFERPSFAWLDKLADPLQQAASRVFNSNDASRMVKSLLNGTPLRHRVHPALIIWPLGAWTMAFVFDVLDSRGGKQSRTYRASADTCVGFGILGALPTATSGLADWVDTGGHSRRVGTAHALLNGMALGLYGASYALRQADGDQRRGLARLLAGLGFGAIMMSGAIGGELVYTLGVNVPFTLYPKPPNTWMDVLASADLPEDKPVVVEVERVPVLLYRHGGEILAVDAWCPHAGGPLAEGEFEDACVTCPWHGSRFNLRDGGPLRGPASVPLRTFQVRERDGRISLQPSYEGQDWPPPPPPPQTEPIVAEGVH